MKNIIHMKSTWSPQTEDYKNAIVLYDDNWNDFGYRTTFHMTFCDDNGEVKRIGDLRKRKTLYIQLSFLFILQVLAPKYSLEK